MTTTQHRCAWARNHPLETDYHDREWGVPVHDDNQLFEMLTLESAQSGLSWLTILKKREGYRQAFAQFDIPTVAAYDDEKIAALLQNPAIVRHKQKIAATVNNAQRILDVQQQFGSFDAYLWAFVDDTTRMNKWGDESQVPASTALSDTLSKALKKRGFKFIGTTTCYAFMQAVGMVNDHVTGCFRYDEVAEAHPL